MFWGPEKNETCSAISRLAAALLFAAGVASVDVPHAQDEREAMLKRLTTHVNKLADGLPKGKVEQKKGPGSIRALNRLCKPA